MEINPVSHVVNGLDNHGLENGVSENATVEPSKKYEVPLAKLADVKVTDYMSECLDKVAIAEGFANYEVKVDHGSAIGDGFVGVLFKVTIQERDSDRKLSLVLKSPPESYARRHQFDSMSLFKREVFVYSDVLPAFVKFQEEKKINKSLGFFDFPKCFFAEYSEEKDDAIIIMEDLKENGYRMWNKFDPINYDHTKLVVAALGKLHAVSFAMKAQRPEIFAKYKELDDFMSKKLEEESFLGMLVMNVDRAAGTIDENDVKRRNRVLKLKENLKQIMLDAVNPELAEPYAIVTHGDCWSNNFMYQYNRGRPNKIVLLDWQITRYSSPVLDLVYFFFACSDHALRANHYDELLNIYHRSLKDLLDHLGGDTMKQFPLTALLRQLKQFGKFGILMATFLVPMMATKNEDLPDMDFMAENIDTQDPELMAEIIKAFTTKSDAAYKPRMQGDLLDAMRYGYL